MLDLSNHIDRRKLVDQIHHDINKTCVEHFREPPRKHLGASIIGEPCLAKLWANFRWLKQEQFDGRMHRLFNRGHEEEPRLIKWLQLAGFEVKELDPKTNEQFRISGVRGHFGGSLDGLAKAPAHYDLSEDLIVLTEFKTHNDKSFNNLTSKGLRLSKPMHFAQMSCYGRAYNLQYGLYVAVNKNDDNLYIEIVALDWRLADDCFRKAEQIVFSQKMPRKISETPVFSHCRYCHFSGICHGNMAPEKNCRSCSQCYPCPNGQWLCDKTKEILPDEIIATGCNDYARIV